MPKFTDAQILEYLETPSYRDGTVDEWILAKYEHAVSGDSTERALERVHFASKRCGEPRKAGLEQASSMDHALLEVLGRMERA